MALGSYPDMELADARKAARAKRTLVDSGRDPLLEKQNEIDAQLKASAAKKARGKPQRAAQAQCRPLPGGFHVPPDQDRGSSSEPVAKRDRFPEASRSAPQVLAARGGDQFFKVAMRP
jgi:hypothetical protein